MDKVSSRGEGHPLSVERHASASIASQRRAIVTLDAKTSALQRYSRPPKTHLHRVLTRSRKGRIDDDVPSTADYADRLRMAELRVTRPRIAVLEAVYAHPHADTETIFSAVRVGLPEVSRQAVYDVLNALTAVGLVRRIQPLGMVARYESRVGDNHHHVVCRSCGVIADVDCAVGEAPCLTPSDDENILDGFVLVEAEVIYWGLCPECSTVGS